MAIHVVKEKSFLTSWKRSFLTVWMTGVMSHKDTQMVVKTTMARLRTNNLLIVFSTSFLLSRTIRSQPGIPTVLHKSAMQSVENETEIVFFGW